MTVYGELFVCIMQALVLSWVAVLCGVVIGVMTEVGGLLLVSDLPVVVRVLVFTLSVVVSVGYVVLLAACGF